MSTNRVAAGLAVNIVDVAGVKANSDRGLDRVERPGGRGLSGDSGGLRRGSNGEDAGNDGRSETHLDW